MNKLEKGEALDGVFGQRGRCFAVRDGFEKFEKSPFLTQAVPRVGGTPKVVLEKECL
jgi:hypothetical protein